MIGKSKTFTFNDSKVDLQWANYLADPGLPIYTKNFGGIRYCDLENNGGAH